MRIYNCAHLKTRMRVITLSSLLHDWYKWSWLDCHRLLVKHVAHVRHVSPSGFNASSLTQDQLRQDIHSFSSLYSSLSSRVEITCPNCCRKSVRVVKLRAYLNYMCMFSYYTRFYYVFAPYDRVTRASKVTEFMQSNRRDFMIGITISKCFSTLYFIVATRVKRIKICSFSL